MTGRGLLRRMMDLQAGNGDFAELIELDGREAEAPVVDPVLEGTCLSSAWLARQQRLGVPLVLLDRDLVLRWRNAAFQTFREIDGLEYRGRPFPTLFEDFRDSDARREFTEALRRSEGGFAWSGRVHGRGADQRSFDANLNVIPLEYDRNDRPDWYLGVVHDVTDENKHLLRSVFDSILQASLFKDEDTGNHIVRVNTYSRMMAGRLKGRRNWIDVDEDFIEDIGILAAFHDVGKIGTPDAILQKPGKLTNDEWMAMKEHPIQGAMILASHPNPMARDIARSHHERWDGSGYPFGLAGADIPSSARIVAVADVYDALRTRRPYKEPFGEGDTVQRILDGRESHFDPELVEVFETLRAEFDRVFDELRDD